MIHPKAFRAVAPLLMLYVFLSPLTFSRQTKNYRTIATANYQLLFEKRISAEDARLAGKALEGEYAIYHKKFGLSYSQKMKVFILTSSQRLRTESQSLVYDDAVYTNGRIYISLPQVKSQSMQGGIPRVVAHSLLDRIQTCPPWLMEIYAIHAGGDYRRFGKPVSSMTSSFDDLAEEYSRGAGGNSAKQVYALLAATAKFFVEHYSEQKLESVFGQIKRDSSFEQAFETCFGEKIADIERAWSEFVRSQVRG